MYLLVCLFCRLEVCVGSVQFSGLRLTPCTKPHTRQTRVCLYSTAFDVALAACAVLQVGDVLDHCSAVVLRLTPCMPGNFV
jgi:hypothetical protein